jgi:hypothetical protein
MIEQPHIKSWSGRAVKLGDLKGPNARSRYPEEMKKRENLLSIAIGYRDDRSLRDSSEPNSHNTNRSSKILSNLFRTDCSVGVAYC